ncbi:glutathione synthase, partial [Pelagibacteraceae bacterium]|nr:glutathione synthase [Pelagibacteraceae bacterium]
DRRIILIDGEYAGSVARIPAKNSIKANFHAGGSAKKTNLVFRDKKICSLLKPFLKKKGLFFVGIDTIGNYLTEINVTSPTGIQEINQLNNIKIEELFWDKIEKKFKKNN